MFGIDEDEFVGTLVMVLLGTGEGALGGLAILENDVAAASFEKIVDIEVGVMKVSGVNSLDLAGMAVVEVEGVQISKRFIGVLLVVSEMEFESLGFHGIVEASDRVGPIAPCPSGTSGRAAHLVLS